MKYTKLASEEVITRTAEELNANGINVKVVDDKKAASELIASLIPSGSPVMTMTSETLRETGIEELVNVSGEYQSLKNQLYSMDRATQGREMQTLGAAPEYAIGSVHAVTTHGELIIASNSGSQLPAYAYGADHVIWVVGSQKIVNDISEGMKRIEDYVLPLESERARKAYGVPGSNISKLLIIKREVNPTRATVIIVKEMLGY